MITKTTNNFFSHKTKILIDRIRDKLKCEKIKVFGNQITKKNTWENNLDLIEMKNKTNIPNLYFSLIFPTLKTVSYTHLTLPTIYSV